ncbi:YodC family protein [Paraburkholderia sp.]|uniref:YodC family protein n=1 Tax=Paraburkholderia sp. TaxID=1926495 RepID=UPI003D6E853F
MLTATFNVFDASPPVFNVGDVVTLKAGGPRMTVTYAGEVGQMPGERLVCQWFDEHGELRQQAFECDEVRREPRSIPAASVRWGDVANFGRAAREA